ncbi:hypothetical protein CYMTET_56178 [Cymbomonas tetramitiformis]|uniref:DUF6589 domain-containing protein n=1 Tax=Cymbomonas tetramitiformis TaxID=36881 RepID=A0AAE0BBT3_9CHLO|nr:hypothetical protein CYMTET_56178 [Cymbomonas tetramitiformis]
MALEHGKRHWLVPYPGLFHVYWHYLESIMKLGWELGFASLAEILGRKKVRRDAQKGVMEVHHDFLHVVTMGMWAAVIVEWERHVNAGNGDMHGDTKVSDLMAYMEIVCEKNKFAKFWWTQILTKYGFMYFELRRAIRVCDIMTIECIMRRAVHIFKFTLKVKYVIVTLFMLIDLLTSPYRLVAALRHMSTVSLSGVAEKNVPIDVWIENTNLFHKKVSKEHAKAPWVKAVSVLVTPLQTITNRFLQRAHIERLKGHNHPKMEEDIQKVKEMCLSLKMFSVESGEMSLIDHFKASGGATTDERVLPDRYLDVEAHTTRTVLKQTAGIISVIRERELAIHATHAKAEFVHIIGVDAEVEVRLASSAINPATVFNWKPSSPTLVVPTPVSDAEDADTSKRRRMMEKMQAFCGFTPTSELDDVQKAFLVSAGMCTIL